MASDSMDEAMEIRPWKSLKLLSSHAERKQKTQFIEDPKHIHGCKQGVGWGWFNLSLDGSGGGGYRGRRGYRRREGGVELDFIFVVFVSLLSIP